MKHGHNTNTDIRHDSDTDMSTPIIIERNDIIQYNYNGRCRVGMSDTGHA
jgi:hypothetical protein